MNKIEKGISENLIDKQNRYKVKAELVGYPLYPDSDDIYVKDQEEKDINPEEISHLKVHDNMINAGTNNEKDFTNEKSGRDLDVPGSESEEKQKDIGTEDEENEYYSLGGDDHNDLDEDAGE